MQVICFVCREGNGEKEKKKEKKRKRDLKMHDKFSTS